MLLTYLAKCFSGRKFPEPEFSANSNWTFFVPKMTVFVSTKEKLHWPFHVMKVQRNIAL